MPIVSIIIPAYNRERFIDRAVKSALNQTYNDFEIVVVDDGSTDGTYDKLAALADTDKRIRCLRHKSRHGAQKARNTGIGAAHGKWIAFLDSDDEWLPGKLEKQVNTLAAHGFNPWVVVHGNAIWLDTATGRRLPDEVPPVEGDDIYRRLLTKPGPLFPSMLVSFSALEKIDFLDENAQAYQEWDTSIRLARDCRFVYLSDPLFIYHLHSDETISKNKERNIIGYQYILDKFENEIKDICGQDVWEAHQLKQLISCLNCGLWAESDRYYSTISRRDMIFKVLRMCRKLHIRPSRLNALKKIFYPGKKDNNS
jgi:glycosyltransferase involved in cell wall biosynthesis